MELEPSIVQSWPSYVGGLLVSALLWVVRGYAVDIKKIKATYITRAETMRAISEAQQGMTAALAAHQATTAAAFVTLQASVDSRHVEDTANFREVRLRLDTLNDTLLKVALK